MTVFHQATAAVLLLILTLWLQVCRRSCAHRVAETGDDPGHLHTRFDSRGRAGNASGSGHDRSTRSRNSFLGRLLPLRCFPSWELAFYFSGSTYATVGYGDVILPSHWRLLGPLESLTGVLMCGVSVSILFALVTRLVDSQDPQKTSPLNISH